jgi:hypothetical protein
MMSDQTGLAASLPGHAASLPGHAAPSRNRVTPMGEVEAIALRGAWTGNRGIIHSGRDIVRFHASDLWITCALRFRGRWREQWQPHHYTFLFFHDEAVSFAAGHRPCAECRWDSYHGYRTAWAEGLGVEVPSAAAMNHQLHGERIVRGTHRRRLHPTPWGTLPDGTFVRLADPAAADPVAHDPAAADSVAHDPAAARCAVVVGGHLVEWTRGGYRARRPRPTRGLAEVVTPPSTVAALRAGYPVQIDDSALGAGAG